jgi:UDP-glucose 4-epimerase
LPKNSAFTDGTIYKKESLMNILVTGGAGYIGSHMAKVLLARGDEVWVLDNLSTGHAAAAPSGRLVEANIRDRAVVEKVLREHKIEAVIHFAASALVGESVADPAKYYQNNVVSTCELLEAMRAAGVWRIVVSSTAATYGEPTRVPITEQEPQRPINPYGFSKLVMENALRDYCRAYQWGYAALRYFNAAGAAADGSLGEDHDPETHLIPAVLQVALGQRPAVNVHGNDYNTPDGTCVRDFIHVEDLASAHVAAVERLRPGSGLELNLGVGHGYSVNEVVESCRRVTGCKIPVVYGPRRPGDPAVLVADSSRAQRELEWKPNYTSIDAIVETAWNWFRKHPKGYRG